MMTRQIPPSRDLLSFQFYKKRKDFQRKQQLTDKDAKDTLLIVSTSENKFIRNKLVPVASRPFSFQAVKGRVDKAVNSHFRVKRNKAIQTEVQHRELKMNKKETEELFEFLDTALPDIEEALCGNETIDVFFDDLNFLNRIGSDSQFELESSEMAVITELKSFEYETCKGKAVSCVRFTTKCENQAPLVAVSFKERLFFEEKIELHMRSHQSQLYLWNYQDYHR